MKTNTKFRRHSQLGLIILSFIAFVALGLPDGLLGVAWPSIRTDFSLELDAIGLFMTTVVAGYVTSGLLSGYLLSKVGVGRVLAVSCLLTGLALIGYTFAPQWWVMVLFGVIAGLGAGAIDAGLNTYVAAHFNEGLMQWLHASWGVGITIGPIIMTLGLSTLNRWQVGYWIVGGFQLFLAAGFMLTLKMWDQNNVSENKTVEKKLTDYQTPMRETLRNPQVWLSLLLFVLYVGGEISLGTWTYTLLTESRGVDTTVAGFFAGSYWFTFTIGRIVAGLFAKQVGVDKLVIGGVTGAIIGAGLLIWNPSVIANVIAVAVIGLSIAPIFPALMSGTSTRVGQHSAANTIGLQIAATGIGTASIPSLMGVMARYISLEVIPMILFSVYAALMIFYLISAAYSKRQVTVLASSSENTSYAE
ncbi:MAG: MFS transporter [Anaerolineaceae bacterium]|nr:MFS transporter [Anaerolineaceae bacterium]